MSIYPPKQSVDIFANRVLALRNRHLFYFDLLVLLMTPVLAFYLRTEQWPTAQRYGPDILLYTLVALTLRLSIFYLFGFYRRYWRYASSIELAQIIITISLAFVLTISSYLALNTVMPWFALPRSLPIIDAILTMLLIGGGRAGIRLLETLARSVVVSDSLPQRRINVAILGAGHTGELIAREIRMNWQVNLNLVAFLDDDENKWGAQIHSIPVFGNLKQLTKIVEERRVERVIIAMPTATGAAIREITTSCHQLGVSVQIIPGLQDLLNGAVSISRLRNVQIEDLLRRTPIQTDIAAVRQILKGKRVLVTGGGGSIGRELCRQILRCRPTQLILLGHGENSIFEAARELERLLEEEQHALNSTHNGALNGMHNDTHHGVHNGTLNGASNGAYTKGALNGLAHSALPLITPVIADLRFPERLNAVFRTYRPQAVFHAAAHKHVPLMEAHPTEAITNNVWGTRNLLEVSQRFGIERFVMISTDKAVNPTNVMGASKRVAELLVHQAAEQSGRPYQVVRFGNVLGSRGSVLHTFRQQIAAGGPVTVTHPDMVRYFMTIPEAVQLVLQASVLGKGGEVFMLDMGEPIKIVDLARDLIELSGLKVGRDIEIAFSGLRPGEKLFEEMFIPGENYMRTAHEKVLVAANASHFVPAQLQENIDLLIAAAQRDNNAAVIRQLQHLLPEYKVWSPGLSEPNSEVLEQPRNQNRPLVLAPASVQ